MKARLKLIPGAALSLALVACTEQAPTLPGRPANMQIISGDNQSAAAGSELTNPLVAKVTDSNGDPVPNFSVSFVVTAGGGHMFAGFATSNSAGEVRDYWTLGTKASETQHVEVRAVDATTGEKLTFATFTATAVAGAVNKIEKVKGDGQTALLRATLTDSMTARVTDQFGNPIGGVTVNWSVTAGGGSINPTSSVTTASGVAQAEWTLGTHVDPNQANAVVGVSPTATFAAYGQLPPRFTATISGDNQAGIVGQALPVPISVVVKLEDGTPVVGDSVFWTTIFRGPSMSPSRGKTDVNGQASTTVAFGAELGKVGGHVTVRDRVSECAEECLNVAWHAQAWTGGFVSIGAGPAHACGIIARGWAYCWGLNSVGQLGDGTTEVREVPTFVASFLTFTQLDAGQTHTCGLTAGRFVYCWGSNSHFQLGNNSVLYSPTALPVGGGRQFISIAIGGVHGCGLEAGTHVYCWGHNGSGQLGDGTQVNRETPVAVGGGLGFTQIAAGSGHTCAIRTTGAVWCWGYNSGGQLGDGTKLDRSLPVTIQSPIQFAQVVAGDLHTCALTSGGAAYCWGNNSSGQLGRGASGGVEWSYPKAVTGGFAFTKLFGAGEVSCGLLIDGSARCWGGDPVNSSSPAVVPGGRTFTTIAGGFTTGTGSGFLCGLESGGATYCWGTNLFGQLGTGGFGRSSPTIPVKWTTAP